MRRSNANVNRAPGGLSLVENLPGTRRKQIMGILLFVGTISQIQLCLDALCRELGNVTLGELAQREGWQEGEK